MCNQDVAESGWHEDAESDISEIDPGSFKLCCSKLKRYQKVNNQSCVVAFCRGDCYLNCFLNCCQNYSQGKAQDPFPAL